MTLKYRYRKVPRSNKTNDKTPSIPMTLSGSATKFDFTVLIDSGADVSAITKDIAEILNLNLNVPETTSIGIGGKVRSKETTMNIRVGHGSETYTFRVPVMVILDHIDFNILLGRKGFFDKFKIEFDQDKQKVSLKRNS